LFLMRTNRRRIWIAGLVVLGLAAAWAAYALANRPLGPRLNLPAAQPSPNPGGPSPPPLATSAAGASAPAASIERAPLCGGPEQMLILAIGADSRQNNYLYGLADVIRVVRVDFVTPQVTALSLPRDLWVEIPEISDHYGITHGKLNQAYFYGNPGVGYYDGPGAGPGLLARTLELNFGIRPDRYLAVNMRTFVKIVDAVGGIDLYLPDPVDGRPIDENTEDMGYFPAGQHHFTGDEALRFSRIRKTDNAFRRDDRQTQVLCALRQKVLSPQVIDDIPEILAAFSGSVLTDLSPAEMAQLACLAPQVGPGSLRMEDLPEDMLEPTRVYVPSLRNTTFVLDVDIDALRAIVTEFLAGRWPAEDSGPSCE
jgi:LCP family protein required for cell wall assembly